MLCPIPPLLPPSPPHPSSFLLLLSFPPPLLLQVNNTMYFTSAGLRTQMPSNYPLVAKARMYSAQVGKARKFIQRHCWPASWWWGAEGSSLYFLGSRRWLNGPPCCPLGLPSFHQLGGQLHYGHVVAVQGGVRAFFSRAGNKGILLLTYFNSFQ